MPPIDETSLLLLELDRLSAGRLKRRKDLGLLLELGAGPGRRGTLDDLSFSAKFLVRARGMMQRLGPGAEGYDRLSAEFGSHMEKAAAHCRRLLDGAPEGVRRDFADTYLSLTGAGVNNFLELCHDLGWYKNMLIDAGRDTRRPPS